MTEGKNRDSTEWEDIARQSWDDWDRAAADGWIKELKGHGAHLLEYLQKAAFIEEQATEKQEILRLLTAMHKSQWEGDIRHVWAGISSLAILASRRAEEAGDEAADVMLTAIMLAYSMGRHSEVM